jgi:hypothetical protein
MRRFIILFFSVGLSFLSAKGQKGFTEIINEFKIPSNWKSTILKDTIYWPIFKRSQIATWTLEGKDSMKDKVTFFIFNYSNNDELLFSEGINSYYMLSSCLNVSSKSPKSNFKSFQKQGYMFVMSMCPCSTAENISCRQLAEKLYSWSLQ